MQINLNEDASLNTIRTYSSQSISIASHTYSHSIIAASKTVEAWPVDKIEDLASSDVFNKIIQLNPDLVILGYGEMVKFVSPSVFMPLIEAGIAYEYMPLISSFKTYNALLLEGRNIVGAFILKE
tara:strand:+ start:1335 stop:1709 length:375 start_codon:yes stop_codon:yes gene_type:complete